MKIWKRLMAAVAAAVLALSTAVIPSTVTVEAAVPVFEAQDYDVLTNIIGAVESGGQVYGQRNFAEYAGAGANSSKEVTCTLGWAQHYGNEGRTLIQKIYSADPAAFRAIDTKGLIQAKLNVDWEAARWNPSAEEKSVLIALITSPIGKEKQDELFEELMSTFVAECAAKYTNDIRATMMYCEIRHLGGLTPVQRIFNRLNGDYSVDAILASLKKDQNDTSSSTQVGDAMYNSRHEKCAQWVKQYARSTSSDSNSNSNAGQDANADIPVNTDSSTYYIYRLYNRSTGEHFLTKSREETIILRNVGWVYEKVGWTAPKTSGTPIYRLYNPNNGDHHYTKSAEEKSILTKLGWRDEGIAFYSDDNKTVPIYREYNPNAKKSNHNFTSEIAEHSYLTSIGWKDEGSAFYGVA